MEQLNSFDNNVYQNLAGPKSPSVGSDTSEKISNNNLNISDDDGNDALKKPTKKHIQRLVDSDSDQESKTNEHESKNDETFPNSDSESDTTNNKSAPRRRIQLNNDSDSDTTENFIVKNSEQQLRLKNKNNKMRNKFKTLLSSRSEGVSLKEDKNDCNESGKDASSESADEEAESFEEIKKKIKERMSSFKSSVCDPDTSDEETQQQKIVYKQKKESKSTKMISPKPQRMSAKQAMENMHKIKSEANRMLREKEVSLPYHRPKALSLKDIMSRRQPALSSDGKSLPIKMNEKQLQQYAQMLEERQKKMKELWQSESDDDDDDKGVSDEKVNTDIDSKQTLTNENSESNITEIISVPHINNDQSEDNKIHEVSKVSVCAEVEMDPIPNADQTNTSLKTNDESQTDALEEQDSETNITLKYIDSETSIIEENINKSVDEIHAPVTTKVTNTNSLKNNRDPVIVNDVAPHEVNTEDRDTESIHLHFDTEITTTELDPAIKLIDTSRKSTTNLDSSAEAKDISESTNNVMETERDKTNEKKDNDEAMDVDNFSDDELNMDDIDNIIENAEIMRDIEDKVNSPLLLRDISLNVKPKLTGAPGMVINLDGANPFKPKKSGVELLKERFSFFAKLKTPEEMEREKEKKLKPGTQHLKLKQELEEKIAEQRSLEWAKRLEEEKQQQNELKALRGEESDDEYDIDKIEAKLENCENQNNKPEEENVEEDEELLEDDCEMEDKPRRKNAMLDDEAEVSDCDEYENRDDDDKVQNNGLEVNDDLGNDEDSGESESDSDESESSESEEEVEQAKAKKGRIIKAFEDSDDEDGNNEAKTAGDVEHDKVVKEPTVNIVLGSQTISQDDELQLAQRQTLSDDLFTSQESSLIVSQTNDKIDQTGQSVTDMDLGTQTFSILESSKQIDMDSRELNNCDTQTVARELMDIALPSTFTQNIIPIPTETETSQSQPIGEDILALCTGKFYDNQFISQSEINNDPEPSQDYDNFVCDSLTSTEKSQDIVPTTNDVQSTVVEINKVNPDQINLEDLQNKDNTANIVDDNLKSILDELADPEFDSPKPNKFFCGNKNKDSVPDSQIKKRLIIESDDENNEVSEKKRKKLKKKKLEKRALQFSDDEDEVIDEDDCYESEIENDEDPDRVVEYDSEENEIEKKQDKPKKKRKVVDFFEDEAELTSEDEWVGSGDENEAGLDRMEKEEGDNEVFHQGKLQRELGQIHMRDVLDQDKREVRMIQELLFEDGDLGGGGRQRKFRWKNLDGEEETGTLVNDLIESQEDQESEEQWRKQRHEREMFLREMQGKEDNESLNISVNISTKMMSSNEEKLTEKTETNLTEKKTVKDIPSPKKPFILLQQNYGGSLLSRGRGALARLAALAAPLAVDDDAHKPQTTSRRNFVFAAISQDDKPKVTIKRKAESNPSTPKLIKKMKTEEKKNTLKSSLLDHFKV